MTSPQMSGSASKLSRMQDEKVREIQVLNASYKKQKEFVMESMEPSLLEFYLHHTPRSLMDDTILKAQFQQKQRADKEQKLLQMIDTQQQKNIQRATLSSQFNSQARSDQITPGILSSQFTGNMNITGNGKVRQMFEERRKTGQNVLTTTTSSLGSNNNIIYSKSNGMKQGIDKSYPLEPLPLKSRTTTSSRSDPTPHLTSTTRTMPVNLKTKTPSPPVRKTGQVKSNPLSPLSPQESSGGIVTRRPIPVSSVATGLLDSSTKTNRPPVAPTNTKYRDYISTIGSSGGSPGVNNSSFKPDDLTDRLKKLNVNEDKRDSPMRPSGSGSVSLAKKSFSPRSSSGGSPSPSVLKSPAKTGSKTNSSKKPPGPAPPGLVSCKTCGRHFAPDRIEKHETICKKTSLKKRKVFDPTKMRMEGTDAESYIKTVKMSSAMSSKKSSAAQQPVKKADWRKKHEEFINTIRLAKEFQAHIARGGKASDLPPPPPADYSDYIECPHCGRKFNQGAAERHIPKCKNIRSNKR